jgi:Putative MetA-pathway of phenol degradation
MGFTFLMRSRVGSRFAVLFCILGLPGQAWCDHASVGFGVGVASPIGTETALTPPKGTWVVGLRTESIDFNDFSDAEMIRAREADPEGDIHSVDSLNTTALGALYGVTDDFSIGLRLPYVVRHQIREPEHGHGEEEMEPGHDDGDDEDHEHGEPVPEQLVETLGNAEGVGDMTLFGQYRFFQNPETRSYAAFLFGVKMPTGRTDVKSNEGFLLETELQPGSGSWDGLLGLAGTQVLGPVALNASVLYSVVTEGSQETDLGDIFSYNLALSYRVGADAFQTDYGVFDRNVLDLILEVNGEWRDKENRAGVVDKNSGGNIIYVSPGFRYAPIQNFNLGFSFGFPIVSDLNGFQVDPNFRVIGSISASF